MDQRLSVILMANSLFLSRIERWRSCVIVIHFTQQLRIYVVFLSEVDLAWISNLMVLVEELGSLCNPKFIRAVIVTRVIQKTSPIPPTHLSHTVIGCRQFRGKKERNNKVGLFYSSLGIYTRPLLVFLFYILISEEMIRRGEQTIRHKYNNACGRKTETKDSRLAFPLVDRDLIRQRFSSSR